MKKRKLPMLFLALLSGASSIGQITLNNSTLQRDQVLNQYTSVFISSPNNNTILQTVRDQSVLSPALVHSDKYQYFSQSLNNYQQISQTGSTPMTPGVGYILQLGGNGTYTDVDVQTIIQKFAGGSANNGTISTPVTAGKFALLGNPYNDYLDLDYFLLNSNNKTKIKGPIYLWAHNTVISPNNPSDPSNTSPYRYSANDYAMYNVLGGVAAGRSISTSPENGIFSGIQTPSGKLCFGTGFFVTGIGSGNVNFENSMRDSDSSITPQSFKTSTPVTQSLLPTLVTRSRIWLNLEYLEPPTSPPTPPSPATPLKQILIGYSTGYGGESPTDGENDRVFDAPAVSAASFMKFYSYVPNSSNPAITPGNPGANTPLALGIQGRPVFNKNNFFQLGYMVTVEGDYTITTSKDGIFDTTPYYILDSVDNQRHSLPYTFHTAAGTFDTRFRVVFENLTQISQASCGVTMNSIWTTLFANQISGATTYKYEVRDAAGNLIGVYDGNIAPNYLIYQFNLNIPGAIQYNQTYNIRVATYQVDGAWAYGPTCTITTPPPPQTKINTGYCDTVIASRNTSIFCGPVTGQLGFSSSAYRFEVREGSATGPVVGIVENTNSNFQLANLTAFPGGHPHASTDYYVRVQIKYNDSGTPLWQVDANGDPIYGPSCKITTGNPFRLVGGAFDANIYPNPFSNNFSINIKGYSKDKGINLFVYDMLGRLVENRVLKSSDIDTLEIGQNYSSGVYNVVIKQDDDSKTLRVIKR